MIREVDNRSKRSPLALFAGLCLVLLGGCSGLTLGSNQQQITPPTTPTNLAAAAASATQISLAWSPSTDSVAVTGYDVERCQGANCTNFAQIATTVGTTYDDTGLTPSTSYSYRVRATDGAGNLSRYSPAATAVTTAPSPTAPSNLTAVAASGTQINLSWTASTETGGTISKYLVERCQGAGCANFTQVGTSTTASYNNTGLTASTSYSYRVRATDALNNTSPYSNTASATTSGANLPTAPTNLTASATGPAQINLSWTASTELGGTIAQYLVERCQGAGCANFVQVGTSTMTSYNDTGLAASTTYSYRVRATDALNNTGPYSNTANATTSGANLPTAPTNLTASATGPAQINLSWTASTELGGTIAQYLVERCQGAGCANFAQVGTTAATSYNDTGLTGSTSYTYRVRASDTSNNLGPYSTTASATTSAPVLTAPSNLNATATSSSQTNLTWTASTESGGTISGYLVERCQGAGCANFVQVGTSTMTSYNDTGLAASTTYSYRVRAADALNNTGPYSNTANATTTGANLPTAPTNLTASATGPAQINLSWTASTELGGTIGQYLVERCQGAGCANFAQVGTTAATSYNDAGLTGSTSYTYRVRASDTSNNLGPYSTTASATTSAPVLTAPSNLDATDSSSSQINLAWTASTESGGTISEYLVERCEGAGCTNFVQVGTSATTTYNDTGLAASTTYTYQVRATDASNDLSAYSGTASAATSPAEAQVPALVSGFEGSSSGTSNASPMKVPLPDPSIAGNYITVKGYYAPCGACSLAITDDQSNSYTTKVSTSDGNIVVVLARTSAVATAGTRYLTFTWSGGAHPGFAKFSVGQVMNIAPSSPDDGTGTGNGSSSTPTCSSTTPTASGDWVEQETMMDGSGIVTSWTAGSQSDITWSLFNGYTGQGGDSVQDAAQYGVYNSTTALEPTMTMNPSNTWNTGCMFLKAGSSGASLPAGIQLISEHHVNTASGASNSLTWNFPVRGNVHVIFGNASFDTDIVSITSSPSLTWTRIGTEGMGTCTTGSTGGYGGFDAFYAIDSSPSLAMTVTINTTASGNTSPGTYAQGTLAMYDIQSAGTLDANGPFCANGNNTGGTTNWNGVTVSSPKANGLYLTMLSNSSNQTQHYSPGVPDIVICPFTDTGACDENDAHAHYYPPSTSSFTSNWTSDAPTGPWAEVMIGFAPLP